jgi:hypothetical protein
MEKFTDKVNKLLEGNSNPDTNDITSATGRIIKELEAGSTLHNALKQFGGNKAKKMHKKALNAIEDLADELRSDWDNTGWNK